MTTTDGPPPPREGEAPPDPAGEPQPGDEPDGHTRLLRSRKRAWIIFGSALASLIGLIIIAAAVVPLPYVILSPGRATAVDGVVMIEGTETFDPDGEVLFLTVSVSDRRPNAFRVLNGWLDDDIAVEPEDEILGGLSRAEERRINVILMNESQVVAKKVALERLGYTVPAEAFEVGVVEPGSPADGTLEVGDEIVAVDGTPAVELVDLGDAVRARAPGDPATLTVERDDETLEVVVVTRAAPDGAFEGQAQLGVSTISRFAFPVDVEIDTGRVGGPSAGLAFTLTILDVLSTGELTGGKDVAVTGTIDIEGNVGRVGGVEQKAVAARQAGAELFLVPDGEGDEARSHAGDMEVVEVSNLDEAAAALMDAGGDPLPAPV